MDIVPPPVSSTPQRKISGLGLTSFILGTIALMFSWLPIAGCALIPMAILGLALGVPALFIALKDRNRGLGFPIAGIVLNILAILVCLFVLFVIATAAKEASRQMQQQMNTPASAR